MKRIAHRNSNARLCPRARWVLMQSGSHTITKGQVFNTIDAPILIDGQTDTSHGLAVQLAAHEILQGPAKGRPLLGETVGRRGCALARAVFVDAEGPTRHDWRSNEPQRIFTGKCLLSERDWRLDCTGKLIPIPIYAVTNMLNCFVGHCQSDNKAGYGVLSGRRWR